MKYIVFKLENTLHCVFDTGCVETALQNTVDVHSVPHGTVPAELAQSCERVVYTLIDPELEYELYFRNKENIANIVDENINEQGQFNFDLEGEYTPCVCIPTQIDLPCDAVPFDNQTQFYKTLLFMLNRPSQNRIIFAKKHLDHKPQCINKIDGHIALKHFNSNTIYFADWIAKYNKYYCDLQKACI